MSALSDRADALMKNVIALTLDAETAPQDQRNETAIGQLHIAAVALRDAGRGLKIGRTYNLAPIKAQGQPVIQPQLYPDNIKDREK